MSFKRNNDQENIIILGNNQKENISMNSQNSNSSSSYSSQNEHSRENSPAVSKEASINIRKEMVSNNSSMRGAESTITSNGLVGPMNKRKSLNKNDQKQNNIINKKEIIEDEKSNKEEMTEENNDNNNYRDGLETIMEIPPLTKIEKKANNYEFYINDKKKNSEELFYPKNKISTTKYNIITFLPKALLYQFIRLANVYFVAIAIIQCIPIISPLGASTAIAPIAFVFAVSLIREAIEDYQRGKLDKEQNSDLITTYRNNAWTTVKSGELFLGEIIQVKKDGIFPADLLLIDSNLTDGLCYIETGSLDGEKTLKIKYSPNFTKGKFSQKDENINYDNKEKENNFNKRSSGNSEIFVLNKNEEKGIKLNGGKKGILKTRNMNSNAYLSHNQQKSEVELFNSINKNSNNELGKINENNSSKSDNSDTNLEVIDSFDIEGIIQCDMPNPSLYMLNGKANMHLNGKKNEFPLDGKNLLLKGAKLRNTEWIVGIIIYTGHNCKIMKNAKDPVLKMSSLEKLLNKLLIGIFICQAGFSLLSAIGHFIYFRKVNLLINQYKTIQENDGINYYIDYLPFNLIIDSVLNFFTYLLLLNTMIPVSLIITLELVKIVQGIFITMDAKSYSFHRKKFIKTNSVSLNEELGMVDYIFSDKTGTLTCNQMNLKFCVIGQRCYEFIRQGLKSEEILINKKLREKEDIIPFQNYDMIKGSTVPGEKGPSQLPVIKYQNYIITANKKKSICIDFDTSEKLIEEYWKALAICHDCNIQNGEYIGMSPDNIELVKSARLQGFKFDESSSTSTLTLTYNDVDPNRINKKDVKTHTNNNNSNYFNLHRNNSINSINKNNENVLTNTIHQQTFEKLSHIEFTSDRKRESVLVKEGSLYKLYVKGADSIIEELLDESTPPIVLEKSRYFVNLFSKEGYRTLYIAMRLLTEMEYEDFIFDLNKAQSEITNKKEKLDEVYASVEKNLTLLGATIVEDKLQENVPEVIKELREADIKIWMLTGDKLSTAYNIGLSCNLINKNIKTFFIEGVEKKVDDKLNVTNLEEQEQVIINFSKDYKKFIGDFENGFLFQKNKNLQKKNDNTENMKFGILVDEKALLTITENTEMEKIFLDVAKDAVAVICCRVSPLQKSQVVRLMKNYDKTKITLAIGDGGNDVSMIMEAHIGIGIYGEEGLRAAQSSDYAIGEFQVLRRLLFVHGYLNLMRNSMMIIYFFYKNFVFTIVHFFYGFINNFSGQTIIEDWFINLYNLLFTSIPLAGRCILDYSIKPDEGKIVDILIPFLYKEQRENPIFTIKSFLLNLLKGAIHSVINYYISIAVISDTINDDGNESNIWTISVILYTNVLLIVTIDLVIQMKFHNFIVWLLIIFLTFVLYIIFLLCVEAFPVFSSFGTMKITFRSLLIWINILVINGICALFNFVILSIQALFIDSIHNDVLTIKEKDNLLHDYLKTLPEKIKKLLIFKGFYVENNDDKEKKPKVNRSYKKHSSLRKEKKKSQKRNCVEFIGIENTKEREKENEKEKEKEKIMDINNNTIDYKDKDDEYNINIYNTNKNKILINNNNNNNNFDNQGNIKTEKLNLNINNNLILKNNMYLHNRESLLISDKWPVKVNNNKKIIKIKKSKIANNKTGKNKKTNETEKKIVYYWFIHLED